MSGLDWQAPDFLSNTSQDDYLASLSSFLDGPQSKYPQDLSVYGTQLPQLDQFGTTLGGGIGGQTGQSPSSPELTSDSGASPSSSHDGQNNSKQQRRSTGGGSDLSSSHQTISHDKRKNGETSTIAIKDRRSSHGKSTAPLPHHSHPDGIDGEITRSASPEDDEDGKRGGKKTSEKRKAQNRQAQRNFRERKEKHLKDLEDKVGALEQRANDTESENSALKQLLQQLKSENERLKVFESAFSFSYDKDVNNSSTMPTSSTFQDKPSSTSSSASQPATSTSPLSLDEANTSFSFDNSSFELPVSHPTTSSTHTSYDSTSYPSTSIPDFSTSAFADNLFLNSLTAPPSLSASNSPISPSTAASSSSVTTPPSSTAPDLFASYRDPLADLALPSASLATLADFDALFNNHGLDIHSPASQEQFKQFIKSPSPLTEFLPMPPSTEGKQKLEFIGQPNCPYGMKEGEKYEFDLDGLCSEMKLKATCQEAARQALKSAMAEDAKISPGALVDSPNSQY